MGELLENLQYKLKTSSTSIITFMVRLFTGLFLGLTLALILDVMLNYGTFSFLLVILVTTAVLVRISRRWTLFNIIVFDLVCVLVALLLRMYVLIAPGA